MVEDWQVIAALDVPDKTAVGWLAAGCDEEVVDSTHREHQVVVVDVVDIASLKVGVSCLSGMCSLPKP